MIRIRSGAARRAAAAGVTAAALLGVTACGDDGPAGTADDPVTLTFAYWGGEARVALTEEAIDLFEQKNEGIVVETSYADYPEHWNALTPRMASGDLPDVIQMDYSRLREWADAGLLANLDGLVDTSDFREGFLDTGYLNDELVAVPMAGNTLGLLYRSDYYDEAGVDYPQAGMTWQDYLDSLVALTDGLGEDRWGAGDFGTQYHFMELWLRQHGGSFYTEDGTGLNFDQATLTEWWSLTEEIRDGSGIMPIEVGAELDEDPLPLGMTANSLGWDNFMNWYSGPVNEAGGNMEITGPPSDDPNNLGLYLKPSMQLTIAGNSEHPEEAGKLIEFLLTDPEAAAILGTDRGIPATNTALDSVELDETSQKILDYEASVAQYLSTPPAAPPAAAGDIEATMIEIYERVLHGEITLDAGVTQFFDQAQQFLG